MKPRLIGLLILLVVSCGLVTVVQAQGRRLDLALKVTKVEFVADRGVIEIQYQVQTTNVGWKAAFSLFVNLPWDRMIISHPPEDVNKRLVESVRVPREWMLSGQRVELELIPANVEVDNNAENNRFMQTIEVGYLPVCPVAQTQRVDCASCGTLCPVVIPEELNQTLQFWVTVILGSIVVIMMVILARKLLAPKLVVPKLTAEWLMVTALKEKRPEKCRRGRQHVEFLSLTFAADSQPMLGAYYLLLHRDGQVKERIELTSQEGQPNLRRAFEQARRYGYQVTVEAIVGCTQAQMKVKYSLCVGWPIGWVEATETIPFSGKGRLLSEPIEVEGEDSLILWNRFSSAVQSALVQFSLEIGEQ